MAELNQRVKNTLATVQPIAAQTLRSARGDTMRFTHEFSQRLQVLAAAHNLLTAHSWGRRTSSPSCRLRSARGWTTTAAEACRVSAPSASVMG